MIREATVADLARMGTAAEEFYASSRFLKRFDHRKFRDVWSALIDTGMGVIFLVEQHRAIVGAIGGVIYPEPYSGARIATEFFWFIEKDQRGDGLKLYRRFEQWARARDCAEIRMVHLTDSMPERLQAVYQRLGYAAAEVHYVKELQQ